MIVCRSSSGPPVEQMDVTVGAESDLTGSGTVGRAGPPRAGDPFLGHPRRTSDENARPATAATALVADVPVGLLTVDRDLFITAANRAMLALLSDGGGEAEAGQLIDRSVGVAFPRAAAVVEQACQSVLQTGTAVAGLEVVAPSSGPWLPGRWRVDAFPLPDADGAVGSLAVSVQDVTELSQQVARLSALQAVTAALSSATSVEQVLEVALAEATGAVGGAAGSVGLLDADGRLLRTITTGFPEDVTQAFSRLALDAPLPGPAVFRDGNARYYPDQASAAAEFPGAAEVVTGSRFQAAAVEALTIGDTRLGYLSVHFTEHGQLAAADRALLAALARQCAIAVDRARRADAARAERDLARRLQSVAARFAAAAGVADVAQVLADAATELLGATVALVNVYDPESRSLAMVSASDAAPAAITSRFARWSVEAPLPARDVFRTGRSVLLRSLAERDQRYPALADIDVEQEAWANLLLQAHGRPLGLVAIGWEQPRDFTAESLDLMDVIARLCSGALERARLGDAHQQIAETLQRELLPPDLPRLPGFTIAARYRPAGVAARAGGDWYDAFALPGGRLGLLIGDVAGHGVAAAALMGQVRALARAEARSGGDPGAALTRLNASTCEIAPGPAQTLVTCCYLQLDPKSGCVLASSAGHLPPLVRRLAPGAREPQPTADFMDLRPGIPLGIGTEARYDTSTCAFSPGSIVVLYTDGLVERRGRTLDEELEALRRLVTTTSLEVDGLCDQLLTSLAADIDGADDIALIAVRSHA
jgi:serine phosphatase RsbU (regulator of sigma subunit)